MTRIVVDSTCDLPADTMKSLDIVSVPLKVHFGDEVFRDKVDLDSEQFFSRLEQAARLPTTSQPSPGEFMEAFGSIPEGETILSIHISSVLSGTLQSAQLAASQLEGRDIRVIDSGSVSWAAGLLVMVAAEAIAAGRTADEVEKLIDDLKPRLRLLAVLDTLKYVVMGGRVSAIQGMLGGMLRVKPIILVRDGEIHRGAPARTWGQAQQKLLSDVREDGGASRFAVMHARAPEVAAAFKALLQAEYPEARIYEGTIGPVVGTHVGPGALGLAYIAGRDD
jgi:DegV family protein with EDD domain